MPSFLPLPTAAPAAPSAFILFAHLLCLFLARLLSPLFAFPSLFSSNLLFSVFSIFAFLLAVALGAFGGLAALATLIFRRR